MTSWRGCLLWSTAVLAASSCFAEVIISTDFEGGSLGECKSLPENRFECGVNGQTDQDGRNRQASWYHFRIDGAAGSELTIDLTGLAGEYNYQPNLGAISGKTPPWISYDQKEWTPLTDLEYQAAPPRLRFRLKPEHDPVWIAHVPPYTNAHLDRLLAGIGEPPFLTKEIIGKTVEGRDLLLLTFTDRSEPDGSKKVVWLMFRQHAWESGSSWVADGALRYLASGPDREFLKTTIFKVFPLCDPDGVAAGGVRFNKHGYDLNRNWDHVIPERMPEIAAQLKAVTEWLEAGRRIDFFMTVHNTETAEYIEGPPERSEDDKEAMLRFYHILGQDTAFSATRPAAPARTTTVAGRKGSMTVNQYLAVELGVPAYLMELAISKSPKLKRHPTIDDRRQFGRDLVDAIIRAVRPPAR